MTRSRSRRWWLRTASAAVAGLLAPPLAAAPRAALWERWTVHTPGAAIAPDHRPWQALLARYLAGEDDISRFAYAAVSADDRRRLDGYVRDLAATAVDGLDRPQQMAYWINLYNALTVQVVLAHYPVASIRDIDISPGLFSDGPWGRKLVTVAGEPVSLDDIEHRILRPIWRDPRVHYALNCASLGCPDLGAAPYAAGELDAMLDAAARRFVNHPRGARVTDDGLHVSSIYIWFEDDFGGSDAAVVDHLRRHAAPPLADRLAGVRRIAGHSYDWRLNDRSA